MLNKNQQIVFVCIGLIVGLLAMSIYRPVEAQGLFLRPPFDSTFRLTSFFDHSFPNYGDDNQMTIYTGESVVDCSPHCYEGHSGYDWAMPQVGTPILAAASGIVETADDVSNTGYGKRVVLKHSGNYWIEWQQW